MILLSIVLLCGCTTDEYASVSDSNQNIDSSKFIGTWIGDMEFSMFNRGGNIDTEQPHVTEIEFTKDTMYMMIETNNGTQTISQTYEIEGDQIVLSLGFQGERPGFNGEMPPFDGERPDWMPEQNNETRPPFDGERPFDGEPPTDGERPFNRTLPSDGETPDRTRTFTYDFNKDYTILYLDESPFLKI